MLFFFAEWAKNKYGLSFEFSIFPVFSASQVTPWRDGRWNKKTGVGLSLPQNLTFMGITIFLQFI
jgi:hypothetical protein